MAYARRVADHQLAIVDPSGRLIGEIQALAALAHVSLRMVRPGEPVTGCVAALLAPAIAADLGPAPPDGPPRWIVGDGASAARLAGAASRAGAPGVLLPPVALRAREGVVHDHPAL